MVMSKSVSIMLYLYFVLCRTGDLRDLHLSFRRQRRMCLRDSSRDLVSWFFGLSGGLFFWFSVFLVSPGVWFLGFLVCWFFGFSVFLVFGFFGVGGVPFFCFGVFWFSGVLGCLLV